MEVRAFPCLKCETWGTHGLVVGLRPLDMGHPPSQVVIPGVIFGLAHLAVLEHGIAVGLGTIIPTTMMGMIWGIAFLLGRRSVVPTVVSHFLNDATVLPWILFFSVTHARPH